MLVIRLHMDMDLSDENSLKSFSKKKEIMRLLSTDQYLKEFYRFTNNGIIPQTKFEIFCKNVKVLWNRVKSLYIFLIVYYSMPEKILIDLKKNLSKNKKFILNYESIKQIFKKKVNSIEYPYYCSKEQHDFHMKSLLEKSVKLKSMGIVYDNENNKNYGLHELREEKYNFDEKLSYDDVVNSFLSDDKKYIDYRKKIEEERIRMIKLYGESNGITMDSSDFDMYYNFAYDIMKRDEE